MPIKTTKTDFPAIKRGALWVDDEAKHLYSWGGEGTSDDSEGAEDKNLWTFEPDGDGGGKWMAKSPKNPPDRASEAGYATCGNTGYLLGGILNELTDSSFDVEDEPYEGFHSLDLKTGKWAKKDTGDFNAPYGSYQGGRATCGSITDSDPLLFFFGGRAAKEKDETPTDMPFNKLNFYDTKTEKWYVQSTRGDIPSGRGYFCAVGTQSPSGSYEM